MLDQNAASTGRGICHPAPRSLLFVPADSGHKIEKALATAADVVILDLEDAVAPSAKNEARRLASDVLRRERSKRIAIRINAYGTPDHHHDIAAIGGLAADIVMLPKCECATDINRLCAQLSVLEAAAGTEIGVTAIVPLVTETASALGALDYRSATARLAALAFAGEDLSADLGVTARDESGMNPILEDARRAVAIAASAAGVSAIDTPFPNPRDNEGLAAEASTGARLGYTGKMCIHPGQIEVVHAAFQPSDATIAWAEAVVGAFASAPAEGVTLLDGKMIDRAHLRLAERHLARRNLSMEGHAYAN